MTTNYPNPNPPQVPNWPPQGPPPQGPPPQAPPWPPQGPPAFHMPPPQQQVPDQSLQHALAAEREHGARLHNAMHPHHTGLWVVLCLFVAIAVGGIGGAVGYTQGVGNKVVVTETTPGPVVTQIGPTATVTATVAAEPETAQAGADTPNVATLKRVWVALNTSDRDSIRAAWKKYKDDPTTAAAYSKTFRDGMTSMPDLTVAETVTFLDWTQQN